jgi:hypothetical protein
MNSRVLLSVLLWMSGGVAFSQTAVTSTTLESRRAAVDPDLSADPDSAFWNGMPSVALDKHIITGEPMPNLAAEVRSRWTDTNLYFLFVGKFASIRTKPETDLTAETYRLWTWDCFEAYVDNIDDPPHRYRELQMSPRGEWLDLDIDSTRERIGGNDQRLWDSGMNVTARIDEAKKVPDGRPVHRVGGAGTPPALRPPRCTPPCGQARVLRAPPDFLRRMSRP